MPFLLQEMSIGRSPEASQISEALSPFRTESRTNFSLKCGGAGKDEAIYAFGMVLHALRKCKWARQQSTTTRCCCKGKKDYSSASLWRAISLGNDAENAPDLHPIHTLEKQEWRSSWHHYDVRFAHKNGVCMRSFNYH